MPGSMPKKRDFSFYKSVSVHDLPVLVIDSGQINQHIQGLRHPEINSGIEYTCRAAAIIQDTGIITDSEGIHWEAPFVIWPDGKIDRAVRLPVYKKQKTETGYSHSMFPVFEVSFPLSVILSRSIIGATTLEHFVGVRIHTKPRIAANCRQLRKSVLDHLEN